MSLSKKDALINILLRYKESDEILEAIEEIDYVYKFLKDEEVCTCQDRN